MLKINSLIIYFLSLIFIFSCNSNDDSIEEVTATTSSPIENETEQIPELSKETLNQINSFVYRGLNAFYLYKDSSPDLADNRFSSPTAFTNFISNAGAPEAFFEELLITEDRFSYITSDLTELENSRQGISLSNGLNFRRIRYAGDNVFIVITEVVKNSPAYNAGIIRGMIFSQINGVQMDIDNQIKLFTDTSFSLGEATIINNTIVPNGNTISLTKIQFTENPIAIAKVITDGSHNIGYLQYNSFLFDSQEQLNEEFSNFKSQNVTDFVLDLRYNGGGSVATANALSSMLTGDFTGQIITKEKWNTQIQQQLEIQNPEFLQDVFKDTTSQGTQINSLRLSKLYVITTKENTASASEQVINSLKPYINVKVIGDERGTVGKAQGSITLIDSPNFFDKEDINKTHNYAMQPLVVDSVNSNDIGVPKNGIFPDIIATEDIENLGVLGDPNEPLLRAAINDITGRDIASAKKITPNIGIDIGGSTEYSPTFQRMYLDKVLTP